MFLTLRPAFLLLSFSLSCLFSSAGHLALVHIRKLHRSIINCFIPCCCCCCFFPPNVSFSQCLFSKSVVSHTQASSKNGIFNLTQVMTAGGPLLHRPPPLFLPARINHGKDERINRPLKSETHTFPGPPLVSPPSVFSLCLADLASNLVAVDVGFFLLTGFFSRKMVPNACPKIKAETDLS